MTILLQLSASSGITAIAIANFAGIAELQYVSEVLLGIEIIVLVVVELATLDYTISTPCIICDRFRTVGIVKLDVM